MWTNFENAFTSWFIRFLYVGLNTTDFHLTCNMLLHYVVKVENPKKCYWFWQHPQQTVDMVLKTLCIALDRQWLCSRTVLTWISILLLINSRETRHTHAHRHARTHLTGIFQLNQGQPAAPHDFLSPFFEICIKFFISACQLHKNLKAAAEAAKNM